MRTPQYQLLTDRSTLALYLAWELGVRLAVRHLRKPNLLSLGGRYIIPLAHNQTRLHREAVSAAKRISNAAAYLEGKIGYPLKAHEITIERIKTGAST